MAEDGLITQTGTGPDVTASIQEEITGLWKRSVRRCESIGGTGDAITCTVAPALAPLGVVDGMQFLIVPAANNTGSVTLAINGGAAIAVVDAFGEPLEAGDLVEDRLYTLIAEGNELRVAAGSGGDDGGSYAKRIYTASDTWVKPAGLTSVLVTVLAGGGAGGGNSSASSNGRGGGGGGAGGVAIKRVLAASLGPTEAVTVGAGGTGVTNANGGAGGGSSFGTHCVASGGSGGERGTDSGTTGDPGADGIGTVGDLVYKSAIGATAGSAGGQGGNGGVPPAMFVTAPGLAPASVGNGNAAAANSGAGGSGSRWSANDAYAGGNGGSGLVIVEEFY